MNSYWILVKANHAITLDFPVLLDAWNLTPNKFSYNP